LRERLSVSTKERAAFLTKQNFKLTNNASTYTNYDYERLDDGGNILYQISYPANIEVQLYEQKIRQQDGINYKISKDFIGYFFCSRKKEDNSLDRLENRILNDMKNMESSEVITSGLINGNRI